MQPSPPSVQNGAHERILENEDHYYTTISLADSDEPLLAEPDPERAMRRIQEAAGLNAVQASEAMSKGAVTTALPGAEARGPESVVGKTTDFVGVAFLDAARRAANSVARIVTSDLQALGTGFLISDRLLITNNHVIASADEARDYRAEFFYELDLGRKPRTVTHFSLDPDAFFITDSQDDLDYTVVALGQRIDGIGEASDFGFCPLSDSNDKHMLGEYVNIIEHPEGAYKQAVLRENQLVWRLENVLHYMADTNPGSSGSPVFNDQFVAIALHHWGEPHREQNEKGQREINEGIRISSIVKELKVAQGLTPQQGRLLQDALALGAIEVNTPQPEAIRNAPVTSPRSDGPVIKDGTATWTFPITVSVRIGDQPGAAQPASPSAGASASASAGAGAAEKIKIEKPYTNRNGYNADFLSGNRIALPAMTDAMKTLAARKLQIAAGEDPHELKYQHFSVVMNARRQMAYFTATNIDGSTWMAINRKTGAITQGGGTHESFGDAEGAEATEVWFNDDRIALQDQTVQALYDSQHPRVFDRGHLTRRQDPAWGTADRARRANADTFHFTNCTPQQFNFNQRAKFWQGIENYVLDNAVADREKVSVFQGPVFRDDDRSYRTVFVPMRFWKIVARVENGTLKTTALIADQTSNITEMPGERMGAENFDDLGDVKQYQTTVKAIEELTGLDFGEDMRNADTAPSGPEALGPEATQRELGDFADVRLG